MPYADLETGVRLHYEVVGERPPVLLIPASSLGGAVWHPRPADDLAARFSVITFDPRGIGRSFARDEFLTIEQLAADAAALLRHLGATPAHVLGHSLGGGVALSLSLTYPRLVGSLTLAASIAGATIRSGEAFLPLPTVNALVPLVERGFEEHVRRQLFESDTMFSPAFRARDPEEVTAFWERTWPTHADLRWHFRHQLARHTFEASHRLHDVQVPTLVLVGSADVGGERPKLAGSRILAEQIPEAELVVLEGIGHGMFWEDPEGTIEILMKWFDQNAPDDGRSMRTPR